MNELTSKGTTTKRIHSVTKSDPGPGFTKHLKYELKLSFWDFPQDLRFFLTPVSQRTNEKILSSNLRTVLNYLRLGLSSLKWRRSHMALERRYRRRHLTFRLKMSIIRDRGNPMDVDDTVLFARYRFTRLTILFIVDNVTEKLDSAFTKWSMAITPLHKVLVALWCGHLRV